MMSQYLPLDKFKAIYVVDLCTSLCDQARAKVVSKGWNNVFVVEGDACAFTPPEGVATLVTFSYSLSSKPRCVRSLDLGSTLLITFQTTRLAEVQASIHAAQCANGR